MVCNTASYFLLACIMYYDPIINKQQCQCNYKYNTGNKIENSIWIKEKLFIQADDIKYSNFVMK